MPDHLHALPAGHRMGEYRIDHVLGSGGFGITYYAQDIHLDKPVAIKEYLPNEFALRTDATTVKPKSSADQDDYQWGLERFLDEARALARFDHPHLNKVHRFFEDNGTAYIVLEYIEGETLSQILKREGGLEQDRLRRLLDELLSGLEEVHAAGYVHRDLKPGNIMLREDGSAVLLDFGAARQAVGQRSKSITSILTPGYAPIEQYDQKAEDVGPWSDLYALGMVAYRCVSGIGDSEMPDAVARARLERKGEGDKDLAAAVEVGKSRYDETLLRAVDWAIRVDEEQRPQSVAALRAVLGGDSAPKASSPPPVTASAAPPPVQPVAAPPTVAGSKGGSWRRIMLGSLLAVAVGLAAAAATVVGLPLWQERTAWQAARCDDEASLRGYLSAYPVGRYRADAQTCLAAIQAEEQERQYWREVECGDAASVRRYLEVYPGGRYDLEAKACLTEIEVKRKAEAEKKRKAEAARKQREAEEARLAAEAEAKRKAEEAKRLVRPGRVFRDCEDCPEMVVLPAGAFTMGSPASEANRYSKEGPQHRVTIARPFAAGKHEVTFAEWEACRRAGGCSHNPDDYNWGRGNRPAINVSWDDAQEYVRWLSGKTGKRYRLLSESEWEYAARAGTTTPFHFGATISTNQANYNGNHTYGSGRKGVFRKRTVAVGSFPANGFGLHDMHGNVWEWAEDCWHGSYAGAPADGSAWTRGGNCGARVLRGGSWGSGPGSLRSADRGGKLTWSQNNIAGFRVARTLIP